MPSLPCVGINIILCAPIVALCVIGVGLSMRCHIRAILLNMTAYRMTTSGVGGREDGN